MAQERNQALMRPYTSSLGIPYDANYELPNSGSIVTKSSTSYHTASEIYSTVENLKLKSKYGEMLSTMGLIPPVEVEVDWSGKGQHIEYEKGEYIPLAVEQTIGFSSSALIESVRCRRIRLARKSIQVHRRAKLDDLVKEVAHLHKVRHPHVAHLVGSYLQEHTFAILMYPAATGDLGQLLEHWRPVRDISSSAIMLMTDLMRFILCLTHVVDYLHTNGIKHLDIKPKNILVHEGLGDGGVVTRKVVLTDFGISQSFKLEDGSQTNSLISMTKKWCSPEVANGRSHGRASDIFSLGCVFIEMCTAICGMSSGDFEDFRKNDLDGDLSFQANLPKVRTWVTSLRDEFPGPVSKRYQNRPLRRRALQKKYHPPAGFADLLHRMIEEDPTKRPTAGEIMLDIDSLSFGASKIHPWCSSKWRCCEQNPDGFRVADDNMVFGDFNTNLNSSRRIDFGDIWTKKDISTGSEHWEKVELI